MHTPHLATLYAHMDLSMRLQVKAGDFVTAGQVIGYEGMTGNTTGPHLHFEVRVDDQFANPLSYLPANGN
jgi:murein DD-endopeptidase MepM/ murein hydrolase activator NlpD